MRLAVMAAAAALLAGCGAREGGAAPRPADLAAARAAAARLKSEGGQVLGLARPANMPAYAVLPPDSFVTAAGEAEQGPATGWVEFSTALTPGAVAAFYEETLPAAGLRQIEHTRDGLVAVGGGRGLKLTVRPLDGVGSEVRLSYS